MGTLTVGTPRLAEHCPHKLPTSCRLTSTPNCCACADNRPHSLTYSVYVDGVGFVQRGTRWQNYCWFCKTFWDNRLTASGLSPTRTRIPEHPDTTEFLARWFEFHQGYQLIIKPDGTEERQAVTGEPLKEADPGRLPRTLDQLRDLAVDNGRRPSQIPNGSGQRRGDPSLELLTAPVQSIEDIIDDLLATAEDEEQATPSQSTEVTTYSSPARVNHTASAAARAQIHQPIIPNDRIQQLRRQRHREPQERLAERIARVFGSREEIQSDEYVSPIAGMFNRAWGRYRNLEDLRRAQDDPAAIERFLDNMEQESALWYATPSGQQALLDIQRGSQNEHDPRYARIMHVLQYMDSQRENSGIADRHLRSEAAGEATSIQQPSASDGPRYLGLDGDNRPEPLNDEQLTVKLDCKVCLTQKASIACLPCGHLGMCEWCADQIIPVKKTDKTQPRHRKRCPMCRKWVNRRVQIFTP